MSTPSRPSRIKPGLDTKFFIDYEWWQKEDRDLRAYLISHLPPEQRNQFDIHSTEQIIDWIDPNTAEVRQVDSLQQNLVEVMRNEQFINEHTTLVDAVFRVFLTNNNTPLSPNEISSLINKPAATILRTLAGGQGQVYKGLRPAPEATK